MGEKSTKRDMFRFRPNKITKITPSGNLKNGTRFPKARSGHRIVANNAAVYSFGGYNPQVEVDEDDFLHGEEDWLATCPLFKELWKFNLVSKTWVKLKNNGRMPEELASHAAVMCNDVLLVFGGTGVPFGASSSNKLHMCNLNEPDWTLIETTGSQPVEQYGQAMTFYEGCLYVVGGTTGFDYSIDVYKFDLNTRAWEELIPTTSKPAERYRSEIAIYNDKIYVFGGGTTMISYGFKKVPVFDIINRKWVKIKTYPDLRIAEGFPQPRRCHGCVTNGSYVYICGGYDGVTVFSDIWKINLPTMQWTKLRQSLPRPVYFHSTALSPSGQMFIFGGVTSIGENKRTSNLYSVWLTIPPLKELAWLAVQHYAPNLSSIPKEKLLECGIPVSCLERIDFSDSNPTIVPPPNPQAAMP